MTCDMQTWVGAYVLDALEPDETEALRAHIAGCAICQDEVVMLSWIPALLRSVDLEGVERLDGGGIGATSAATNADATTSTATTSTATDSDATTAAGTRPPLVMLDHLLASIHMAKRARRLRRPATLLLGTAVAATIAGTATVASGAFDGTQRSPAPTALQVVDPTSHASAAVTLTGRRWGTELHLTLSWVAAGQQCSLIAHSRDGHSDVAATWVASYRGTASVPAATAIPAGQLTELDVVTADGRQLVRIVVPHKTK
jgi:hypothetical protein